MIMSVPISIKKYLGTWFIQGHGDVEYSVSLKNESVNIIGVDTSDGEELRIENISFNGSELRFSSICPSNGYELTHVFRSIGGDRIEHEFTRIENWVRKETS